MTETASLVPYLLTVTIARDIAEEGSYERRLKGGRTRRAAGAYEAVSEEILELREEVEVLRREVAALKRGVLEELERVKETLAFEKGV